MEVDTQHARARTMVSRDEAPHQIEDDAAKSRLAMRSYYIPYTAWTQLTARILQFKAANRQACRRCRPPQRGPAFPAGQPLVRRVQA